MVNTAALFLALTASTSVAAPGNAAYADVASNAVVSTMVVTVRFIGFSCGYASGNSVSCLQLRDLARAVAHLLHRNSSSVQQGQQQVRKRRLIRNLNMLATLDLTHAAAQHCCRQREVVMGVAIAHVASEKDDRMVQHRSVAIGHLRKFR